ncbi:MAG: HD-GYP domain-containing protein, partial [Methylobacter sp.]
NVVEYAGGHHERMDGKGYPKGLMRDQMSIPARVMAIADVFEALTAKDRPYKSGKKLSDALSILKKMKEDKHIDPDLYDAFIEHKIYKKYAEKFLDAYQIDVD